MMKMRCRCRATNVLYPWHEENRHTGTCTRCGEITDAGLHAAHLAEVRRRLAEEERWERECEYTSPKGDYLRLLLRDEMSRPVATE